MHIDALGWLYVIWGAFGLLTGFSLEILVWGTYASLDSIRDAAPGGHPAVWLLLAFGVLLLALGGLMVATGRAMLRRRRTARIAALLLAIVNLLIVPFGTALAAYTFWTLVNEDARREFPQVDTISG